MPKNSKKRVVPPSRKELKQKRNGEVLTRREITLMFENNFENIKDLIQSTAKQTETVLGEKIETISEGLKYTQTALKTVNSDLIERIETVNSKIDSTKTDLIEKIESVETRLSEKIDGIRVRVEDHEERITALESTSRPQS